MSVVSQRLGRHRWTIERTMAWLAGCRRLLRRYERKAEHFLARWGLRQRRAAAGHFVRGLSYGAGITAASAVGYWIQQLL